MSRELESAQYCNFKGNDELPAAIVGAQLIFTLSINEICYS
jgi:hypothetical protein